METDPDTPPPPARVTLPAAPAPQRRLSGCFSAPPGPPPARARLAWVSLQGRLVGTQEAASARAVGLAGEEALAWELFTPMQRVLLVAAVVAAGAESRREREIAMLKRSVEIRDHLLLGMQQKLDDLCEHMEPMEAPCVKAGISFGVDDHCTSDENLKPKELHTGSLIAPFEVDKLTGKENAPGVEFDKEEAIEISDVNIAEREERRMSDLSDMFSSAASSVDIQMTMLAADQDRFNLQRECDEKDATIKELVAAIHASNVAESKRIAELEEVIKRKNLVIAKMKKDMLFLEQKVIQLARLRRPSSAKTNLKSNNNSQLPLMLTNILYDMSSSSSSSSDSDSPRKSQKDGGHSLVLFKDDQLEDDDVPVENQQPFPMKDYTSSLMSVRRSFVRSAEQRSVSPLMENFTVNLFNSELNLRDKQLVSSDPDSKKNRRHHGSKFKVTQRRWT